MLTSPLHLTIESELSLLVCFFGPPEEDDALFGVVVLEAMRANGVGELEQGAALWEERDQPRVRRSGGTMQVQKWKVQHKCLLSNCILLTKGLSAWKNNSCPNTLAQLPLAPLLAMLGAYTDRCEALLQLSTLPVILKSTTIRCSIMVLRLINCCPNQLINAHTSYSTQP